MVEPILPVGKQSGMCVHDGTAWRKAKGDADGHQQVDVVSAPTTVVIPASGERLIGFSGIAEEALLNTNLAAGTNYLFGTTVPTGEVWKITTAAIYYYGTTPTRLVIGVDDLAGDLILLFEPSPTAYRWYTWQGEVYLQAGNRMWGEVRGATAGDDLHLRYAGLKMAAP